MPPFLEEISQNPLWPSFVFIPPYCRYIVLFFFNFGWPRGFMYKYSFRFTMDTFTTMYTHPIFQLWFLIKHGGGRKPVQIGHLCDTCSVIGVA